MTDIVERLNNASYENAPSRCMEAAREIERLRAALEPFTKISVGIYGVPDDETPDTAEWFRHDGDVLRVGDFRRACRVLAVSRPECGGTSK